MGIEKPSGLRAALIAAILVSAALFGIGVAIERDQEGSSGHKGTSGEASEGSSETHAEGGASESSGETHSESSEAVMVAAVLALIHLAVSALALVLRSPTTRTQAVASG